MYELGYLYDEMQRLRDGFGRLFAGGGERPSWPLVNLYEDEGAIHLQALVPGLTREQVRLEYDPESGVLAIEGKCANQVGEGTTFLREECRYGDFRKALRIPVPVDGEKIGAKLANGILEVRLEKREEAKPRRITIS